SPRRVGPTGSARCRSSNGGTSAARRCASTACCGPGSTWRAWRWSFPGSAGGSNGPGMDPKVWTLFFGSFIHGDVPRGGEFVPEAVLLARLSGYDIRIEPLANLVPDEAGTVYGILVPATHAELQRLYGQGWVGTYLPHAVLATRPDGAFVPALCYVAPSP